jgi:cardiolipin synthase
VDVRRFNPLRLDSPFGWISRDHRKLITVDGRVAFVAGLCVGELWAGIPEKKIDPWRDTGVEIMGPAVADLERSFADTWASTGPALDSREIPSGDDLQADGNVSLRIVAGVPNTGGVYRIDQLFATLAQRSIWLSDAYFVGTGAYIQALQGAARSGVDVRLLIPGSNNLPVLRAISRAGLRPLLEAGVRVFEWDGSMMHAKTAVVDGQWSRVGSTNLNLSSWLGNRELDILVEDEEFARQMEEMYLEDLSQSTEIVLSKRRRHPSPSVKPPAGQFSKKRSGGASRTVAGVLRLGQSVGAAVTNRRELGPAEAVIMVWGAAFVAVVAAVVAALAILWPWAVAAPLGLIGFWITVSLLIRAYQLRVGGRRRRRNPP